MLHHAMRFALCAPSVRICAARSPAPLSLLAAVTDVSTLYKYILDCAIVLTPNDGINCKYYSYTC
jgi:hypothetical protein